MIALVQMKDEKTFSTNEYDSINNTKHSKI